MGVTVGSMMKKTGWNQPLSVSSLVTTSEGRLVDFRRSNARACESDLGCVLFCFRSTFGLTLPPPNSQSRSRSRSKSPPFSRSHPRPSPLQSRATRLVSVLLSFLHCFKLGLNPLAPSLLSAGVGAFANYHPHVSPTEYPIPDVPFEPSEVKEGQADEENPDPSHKPGSESSNPSSLHTRSI
jgi:hypothetical protein